jgi:hypothetical protein
VWRGTLDVARRPAPLRSGDAAIGVFRRCEIAQSAVRPGVVVVILPGRQHGSNLRERGEQRLVEEFVAQPCVETLANGAKHMRRGVQNHDVHAVIEISGPYVVGGRYPVDFLIKDGSVSTPAAEVFDRISDFWERLYRELGYIEDRFVDSST